MASLDDLKIVLQSIDNTMAEQKSSMLSLVGLQQETVNQISGQTSIFSNMITALETKNRLASVDTNQAQPTEAQENKSMGAAVGAAAAPGVGAGIGAAGGLIGLGAGIAGFMAALSVGSMGLDWLGADYSGLSDAFASFSDAMENLSPAAMIALAGASAIAAGTSSFKNLYGLGTASGMVGLGAGISGFLIGLSLGEVGLSWIGNDYTSLGGALASFSDAIGSLTLEAVGIIGGIATIAVANTALGGNPKSLAANMTGLAAGIAGFLGGLVLTDIGLDWITSISGADGSGLTSAFKMFSESVSALTPESAIILGGLLGIASKFTINPVTIAKGMGGIAAGIGGFLGGLVLADVGLQWLSDIGGADGGALVAAAKMFNDIILALSPESMAALGVLMLAAPLGGSIATGLPAIGVGLAGFLAALAGADAAISVLSSMTGGEPGEGLKSLFTNIFQGIGAAKELEGVDLLGLGAGLISVSAGLAAFGVGSIISGLGQAASAIIGFFTGESAFDQIMKIADNADGLVKGGEALDKITSALSKFADIKISGIDLDFKELAIDLGRAIPFLDALANGGPVKGSAGWFGEDINFPKGLLNPSLRLDEMADAISKINLVLGNTTELTVNPSQGATSGTQTNAQESIGVVPTAQSASIKESVAAAVAESPVISRESESIMLEAQAQTIKSFQAQAELVESRSRDKAQPVAVVDSSSRTDARTFVGGTTNTTIITPRSSNDLDYGLPRSVQ